MKTNLKITTVVTVLTLAATLVGCGKAANTSATPDTSTSGVAASSVGGVLSNSSTNGTQASAKYQKPTLFSSMVPEAMASGTCPTFKTTGSTCTVSAGSMWLNYLGCTFAGYATWTGVQQLSMSSGSAVCGTFPNPGPNGTLYRQFVSSVGGNTPGNMSLVGVLDTATVDNSTANLANFDGQTIAAIHNGGYGTAVSFDSSGNRSSVVIGEHITLSGIYDHSLSGTLTVTEGTAAGQRTVNGQMKLYHNLLKVVATSTFTNVIHNDMCCWPIEGSISTAFTAGQNVPPTLAGSKVVGKTETLTFNGACGSGSLTNIDGSVAAVSFNRCF